MEVPVSDPGFDPGLDPAEARAQVREATERLLASALDLDETALRGPSRCPGWTRAHVLAHIAGNAAGTTRVLRWAQSGVPSPKYASSEARASEIEDGSRNSLPELLSAVSATAEELAGQMDSMTNDDWKVAIPTGPGGTEDPEPASVVPWSRLRELELHHVDLDLDFTPAHWSNEFAQLALLEAMDRLGRRADPPRLVVDATDAAASAQVGGSEGAVLVTGPVRALAAWLTGRGSGDGLAVEPSGPLPVLPPWG